MKELFAGIWTKFNATNTFKTALSGRMYPYEAPQDPIFPYAVYSMVSSLADFDFSDDHEIINVQFSVYSEEPSPSQALDLHGLLKTLFDDAKLTVSGWTLLKFQREQSQLIRDEEFKTWAYHVDYEALLEKSR